MDGKRQISGKLVPEIMFVQAVRASPFPLPQGRYFEDCAGFIFLREWEGTER